MKKEGKRLFRRLGELRDVHVMQDWVHRLDSPGDPVTGPLLQLFSARETLLQQQALQALQAFDRKQWQRWSRFVAPPDGPIPAGKPGFPSPRSGALDRSLQTAPDRDPQPLPGGISPAAHRAQAVPLHCGEFPSRSACRLERRSQAGAGPAWAKFTISTFFGRWRRAQMCFRTRMLVYAGRAESRKERAQRIEIYRKKMLGKSLSGRGGAAALPSPE